MCWRRSGVSAFLMGRREQREQLLVLCPLQRQQAGGGRCCVMSQYLCSHLDLLWCWVLVLEQCWPWLCRAQTLLGFLLWMDPLGSGAWLVFMVVEGAVFPFG